MIVFKRPQFAFFQQALSRALEEGFVPLSQFDPARGKTRIAFKEEVLGGGWVTAHQRAHQEGAREENSKNWYLTTRKIFTSLYEPKNGLPGHI